MHAQSHRDAMSIRLRMSGEGSFLGRDSDTLMHFEGQYSSQLQQATQSARYLMATFPVRASMRNTSWGQMEKQTPQPLHRLRSSASIAM
jgi:hypothetical protein